MKPDATKHNPDPSYARELVARIGLSKKAIAERLDISVRILRYYVAPAGEGYRAMPYTVQFALEALAQRSRQTAKATTQRPTSRAQAQTA